MTNFVTRTGLLCLLLTTACGSGTAALLLDGGPGDALSSGDLQPSDDLVESELASSDVTATDVHKPFVVGNPCDDKDPCTFGESVQAGGSCGEGTAYECDDGRSCTDDLCDGLGDCSFQVADGFCLVGGTCLEDLEAGDGGCAICDASSPFQLTPIADGDSCSDKNSCTEDDICVAGLCTGNFVDCDDGDPCSDDSCDPASGCLSTAASGATCGGNGTCITPGYCVDGECEGEEEVDCDDGNDCTADSCDADEGCTYAPLDGLPCDDGDTCTGGDTCAEDYCEAGPELTDCNDGNECTADLCHPVSGCYHELNDNPCCDDAGVNVCDDGNWCTTDSCDSDSGECFYDNNDFKCNDGDPCTAPDSCAGGGCAGPPADCDDGNPCTDDSCDAEEGCVHVGLDEGACDDGLECSTGDSCSGGECVADLSGCGCQPVFSPQVSKVSSLAIGADGKAGNGLDVDQDQLTCSPDGCDPGIDNSLSILAGLANDSLTSAVEGGSVVLLFEHRDYVADGSPYTLSFYAAEATDDDCDIQTETCAYVVKKESFDEACEPLVKMDNTMIQGTNLTAGGPGYNFSLPLPLADGVLLDLVLYHAQIVGTVGFADGNPGTLDGILAGAISKQDMLDAIAVVPDDAFPIDKQMVLSMIEMLVTADIDSSGDGQLDAASIGLPFGAIAGTISGTGP
jgi:hypothetical protein